MTISPTQTKHQTTDSIFFSEQTFAAVIRIFDVATHLHLTCKWQKERNRSYAVRFLLLLLVYSFYDDRNLFFVLYIIYLFLICIFIYS